MSATARKRRDALIDLPAGWVDTRTLEERFAEAGGVLDGSAKVVVVNIPAGCSLMIGVIIRLLSFSNQAASLGKQVSLRFGAGGDAHGYLSRMGFFENLDAGVDVTPCRPAISGAKIYRGGNRGLVEIARFSGVEPPDREIASNLAKTAQHSCRTRSDANLIFGSVGTIFGELIHNVSEHSGSTLDGFAALQTYTNGNRVQIAVSDSGDGILQTLRPALEAKGDPSAALGDVDLLIEMFRKGISRHDEDKRGNGLMTCAQHAIKFKAGLDLRLPNFSVFLKPSNNQYQSNTAYVRENLPLLMGSHISFDFDLA